MQLIFRHYFSKKSLADCGTLYQLRNVLGRTNVVQRPLDNFNACDDFFVLVVHAHILAAAMKMLGISDVNEIPSSSPFPGLEVEWMESAESRKKMLHSVSSKIVEKFINLDFNVQSEETCDVDSSDEVFAYAKGILSLGCFYLEYSDSIREGDGERVLRCWRYLLPMFHSSRRNNYALESLHVLFQHDFSLPPRLAMELMWGRFVNVHGLRGKNIPNDLHMEHLNRLLKTALQGLGANKTGATIMKSAKVLGVIDPVLANFDSENQVTDISGGHRATKTTRDMELILKHLENVFEETPGRMHRSFKNPRDPLHHKTVEEIKDFIKAHLKL